MGHEAAVRVLKLAGKDLDEGELSMAEFKSWAHSTNLLEDPKRTRIERLSLGKIEQTAPVLD